MRLLGLDRLFLRFRDRHDGAALAAVFDATSRELLGVAFHLVRNPSDAEDLVQSTFLAAIARASSYDGTSPVQGWLYGILWHEAAKTRRSAARAIDPHRLESRSEAEPIDIVADEELRETLARALAALPQRYREVVEPLIRAGERPEQIARRLGRSPGTVRSQIHRGIERLRRAFPEDVARFPAIALAIRGLPEIRATVLRSAGFSPATAAAISPILLKLTLGGALVSKTALVLAAVAIALGGGWFVVHARQPNAEHAEAESNTTRDERMHSGVAPVANAVPTTASREPGTPTIEAPAPDDPVKYWLGRFNESPDDWRHALKIEMEIAKLPPDDGLRIMTAVWPQLSVPAREIAPKAFSEPAVHIHVLKLLHLAATDVAVSVQNRAFHYLAGYGFRDFAEDYDGYLQWAARYDAMPLKDVVTANAQGFVSDLLALSPQELRARCRALERIHLDISSANRVGCDVAKVLKQAGGLKVVEALFQDDDPKSRRRAFQWSKWMEADETWLRTWVLPSVERSSDVDAEEISGALAALERPDCAWATASIVAVLSRTPAGANRAIPAAARALGRIGDPAAIPAMIEFLLHNPGENLRYDVGYFGLSQLTGVTWQDTYDGDWWLAWWEKNKMRFPPNVRDTAIRK